MRLLFAATAALVLGACCHVNKNAADAPAPAAEETPVAPSDNLEPKMLTAEEAARAAAEAQKAAETGVVYAGYDKKGGSITLKKDQILRIELQSIPTAGYIWIVKQVPDNVVVHGESTRGTDPARQSQPGFTGGNHYMSFDYLATKPGTGKFILSEGRPWETDEPPTDTYELTVTVTE